MVGVVVVVVCAVLVPFGFATKSIHNFACTVLDFIRAAEVEAFFNAFNEILRLWRARAQTHARGVTQLVSSHFNLTNEE